jgi:MFS family permease
VDAGRYALAYALVLITGGRLGDSYGRKRLFIMFGLPARRSHNTGTTTV